MSDFAIRPTSADDEGFLWLMLYYASHSDHEVGVSPTDIRRDRELTGYIEGWCGLGHVGVVAETATGPVGAAWLRRLDETDSSNPVYVSAGVPELAIAVQPGMEGGGIGSALLSELLESVSGRFPGVVLSARADNPAITLYERFGFSKVETITNRVGTKSVKMWVRLD